MLQKKIAVLITGCFFSMICHAEDGPVFHHGVKKRKSFAETNIRTSGSLSTQLSITNLNDEPIATIINGKSRDKGQVVGTVSYRKRYRVPIVEPWGDGKKWMYMYMVPEDGVAYIIDEKLRKLVYEIKYDPIRKGERFVIGKWKAQKYFRISKMLKAWKDLKKYQELIVAQEMAETLLKKRTPPPKKKKVVVKKPKPAPARKPVEFGDRKRKMLKRKIVPYETKDFYLDENEREEGM